MRSTLASGLVMAASVTSYRIQGVFFQASDYADDLRMPFHTDDYAHFVFNLQGKVTEVRRNRTHHSGPGSLTFLPRGEPHGCHFHGGVKTFQIILEPQWVERVQQSSALLDTPRDYENGIPVALAMRLYHEFQHRDNLAPLMLEGMMLELLATMSRHATNDPESHLPHWLRKTCDLLHDRFTESLSLNEIAASVGVHPSHLMAGFRQQYHCTVGEYVRRLRVQYASDLLATSNLTASQIAHAAGFADQSHFCRTFKQLTGMTPTQFQKASGHRPCLRQETLA